MEKFQGEMKIISPSGQPEILLLDVWTEDNQKGIADPSETSLEDGQMKIAVYFEKAIDGGRVFPTFLPIESLCFSADDRKTIKEILAKKILRGGINFLLSNINSASNNQGEKIIKKFEPLNLTAIAKEKINEAYN